LQPFISFSQLCDPYSYISRNQLYGKPNGLMGAGNSTIVLSYKKSPHLRGDHHSFNLSQDKGVVSNRCSITVLNTRNCFGSGTLPFHTEVWLYQVIFSYDKNHIMTVGLSYSVV